jgi:hypothetical protein
MAMSEIDDKIEISNFINKRRKKLSVTNPSIEPITDKPTPWYKRPLDKSEFRHKLAKNGRYYIRHKEWGERTWIGPYKSIEDVKAIVDSYVVESLKGSLDRKYDESIHSVIIDNPEAFF